MINIIKGLSYKDVLLQPKYSTIESRKKVDLSVDLGKGIKLDIPIIASNMIHVCEVRMAKRMAELGGLGILHRFYSIEENINLYKYSSTGHKLVIGASVGAKEKDKEHVEKLVEAGCKVICVDIAHGHSKHGVDMTYWIWQNYPDVLLISGSVVTADGALALYDAGADVVRVGIGNGSSCSTRITTGNGVPTITSLSEVKDCADKYGFKFIADGGIQSGGDLSKALCFADVAMLGNLLAGTDESPGQVIEGGGGKRYKCYEGSSTLKTEFIEGVKGYVPYRGSVENVIKNLTDGLRSCCSYQGVDNLTDLKKDPRFVEITNSGWNESMPHSIMDRI